MDGPPFSTTVPDVSSLSPLDWIVGLIGVALSLAFGHAFVLEFIVQPIRDWKRYDPEKDPWGREGGRPGTLRRQVSDYKAGGLRRRRVIRQWLTLFGLVLVITYWWGFR